MSVILACARCHRPLSHPVESCCSASAVAFEPEPGIEYLPPDPLEAIVDDDDELEELRRAKVWP